MHGLLRPVLLQQWRLLALATAAGLIAVAALMVLRRGSGPAETAAIASAPPSVQQVGQVGGDGSLRDDHPSDQATVAVLQRGLPFDVSKAISAQVPPGLQLRYARSLPRQGGSSAQLELHYAAPEWHGGRAPGDAQYAGPLLMLTVSSSGEESIANKNVNVPTGLPGVTLREVTDLPPDNLAFLLQTPTHSYSLTATSRGKGFPTRDQVVAMLLSLAK